MIDSEITDENTLFLSEWKKDQVQPTIGYISLVFSLTFNRWYFGNFWLMADLTVSNICSTDWPKKDSANFESQNFEGP